MRCPAIDHAQVSFVARHEHENLPPHCANAHACERVRGRSSRAAAGCRPRRPSFDPISVTNYADVRFGKNPYSFASAGAGELGASPKLLGTLPCLLASCTIARRVDRGRALPAGLFVVCRRGEEQLSAVRRRAVS